MLNCKIDLFNHTREQTRRYCTLKHKSQAIHFPPTEIYAHTKETSPIKLYKVSTHTQNINHPRHGDNSQITRFPLNETIFIHPAEIQNITPQTEFPPSDTIFIHPAENLTQNLTHNPPTKIFSHSIFIFSFLYIN